MKFNPKKVKRKIQEVKVLESYVNFSTQLERLSAKYQKMWSTIKVEWNGTGNLIKFSCKF